MGQPRHDHAFDLSAMRHALAMGERGLGRCWPNPSVGCVLAKDGRILAAAYTANGGRPHAETQALATAGSAAKGATAYVTLEPCAHHGDTPPCAQALIDAGIQRVVIACTDPDPRVSGKGIAMLQQAGITVETGLLEAEAQAQHAGFFLRLSANRPLVSMKLATSLDGRITNAVGESQWITGEEARQYGHRLRATHDAILTGIGTVLADDPALTCRLEGLEDQSPTRVILDSELRIPLDSALVQSAKDVPLWVVTTAADSTTKAKLEDAGVKVATLQGTRPTLKDAFAWLAEQGITRLLTEGGSQLNGSLWNSGLVDRLYWFRAPIVLGSQGSPVITATVEDAPSILPRLTRKDMIPLGSDWLEIYSSGA